MIKNNKGITLVALVISIIVLLILAGVTLSLTLGENGLISRTEQANKQHEKGALKEEIELAIGDLTIEKSKKGEKITKEDILKILGNELIIIENTGDRIEGEYKDYAIIIDENNRVIIGEELTGEKPIVEIKILTEGEAEEVEIQVIATAKDGEIASIESLNGLTPKTENSVSDKIYKLTRNGEYTFKVKGTNGRTTIQSKKVENVIEVATSILEAIEGIKTSGTVNVRVNGKTSTTATVEKKTYAVDVIRHEGDLVLDGTNTVNGAKLTNKLYEFGSTSDVGTASGNASKTVVLKVEGNLTIESGVTLSAVRDANYGGPKGMVIYCTGTITNNGTITMTARGAKAAGENVYLWKNSNDTWEFVPATGGAGGGAVSAKADSYGGTKLTKGSTRKYRNCTKNRWWWFRKYLL